LQFDTSAALDEEFSQQIPSAPPSSIEFGPGDVHFCPVIHLDQCILSAIMPSMTRIATNTRAINLRSRRAKTTLCRTRSSSNTDGLPTVSLSDSRSVYRLAGIGRVWPRPHPVAIPSTRLCALDNPTRNNSFKQTIKSSARPDCDMVDSSNNDGSIHDGQRNLAGRMEGAETSTAATANNGLVSSRANWI
jgi:hypothetical protein